MSYKTILVHADLSRHAGPRYATAAALAAAHGAHLVGAAASGVSPLFYPAEQGALPGGLLDDYVGAMREQMRAALDHFERVVAPTGLSYEKRCASDGSGDALVALARFADLVVVSQDDPAESIAHSDWRLPEFVIFGSARPVLVVPVHAAENKGATDVRADPAQAQAQAHAAAAPSRILVAWNGSVQAAAAVGHALPLLRQASAVVIAAFDEHGAARAYPATASNDSVDSGQRGAPRDTGDTSEGVDLLAFLARHGVPARFEQHTEPLDMGLALGELAHRHGADLIVMGCYGHSRLREMGLGGVSRTLLRGATIALLMAHR